MDNAVWHLYSKKQNISWNKIYKSCRILINIAKIALKTAVIKFHFNCYNIISNLLSVDRGFLCKFMFLWIQLKGTKPK